MTVVFIVAMLVTLLLTLPFILRVMAGPTIFDRVVAVNGLGTLVPAMLVLVGLIYDRLEMFEDLALALFLLNVFTTLLIARSVRHKAEEAR
jgi:multicomponent Na+:H+ antiporter subunit F